MLDQLVYVNTIGSVRAIVVAENAWLSHSENIGYSEQFADGTLYW